MGNFRLTRKLRKLVPTLAKGTGYSEINTGRSLIDELMGASLNYNTENYLAVTADLSSATWNTVATHELFTVTGLVRVRIIAVVTTTGDDTTGDTSNIQLGTDGDTDGFIAATDVDDLLEDELWYDATPTTKFDTTSTVVIDKTVNTEDVGYEITGEAATAGVIVFHCWWEALDGTGAVVAGAGGAMV